MTARWFERKFCGFCTLGAILIISLIIATIYWCQTPAPPPTKQTPITSDNSILTNHTLDYHKNRIQDGKSHHVRIGSNEIEDGPLTNSNLINISKSPDLEGASKLEFIKPIKILVQSLHVDDLLYESKNYYSGGSNTDTAGQHTTPQHHITGQFRNKSSRIWDPHPQYEIDAFGRHLHLVLNHNSDFMPEDIKVTHVWPNETLRKLDDHKDHALLQGCFYRGTVRGDEKSTVAVNLCGGMKGYIRTSTGSFFIEPVEKYTNDNTNILHAIYQLPANHNHESDDGSDILKDKTNCAVEEQLDIESIELTTPHTRRKRSSSHLSNNEYTIEVLVAVDKKMQEYHREAIKSYVLTLMSIVSSIYADASIGNSIKIAVVHILFVKHDLVPDISAGNGVSASGMLLEFCKLKQKYNLHHDTALLLTREQICRNPNQMKCDTLGLAELGTMCKPSSCAIVQDNGLSAAFTIAHELGHVLNMPHDDDQRCEKFRGPSKTKQNIMSRMLDQNTHPWSWSNCSRHFVTEYLEQNHATCMLDKPELDMIEPSSANSKLAGEKFTDDQQCELVFGSGSKICSYMPRCGRLWCSEGDQEIEGCRTQHMPWADGTPCEHNHWCQKGECVHRNRSALQPQHGAWGHWSPFGYCSRTCGGGVRSSTRSCDSPPPENGGKYCIGARIRYEVCETQDCSENTLSFREEQCQELDNNNFDIPGLDANVKWIPKYGALPEEECKLYCRVQNTTFYFLLKDKVKDGTPCTNPHENFNKCVNGLCRPVGCDNVFDSDAKLDRCGVCNGQNNTCRDTRGSFTHSQFYNMKKPYNQDIVRIPKGATNIEIIQPGYHNDKNYISLVNEDGEYILNPPGRPIKSGFKKLLYAGVTLEYNGPESMVERVNSSFGRRLKRDLIVEIYSKQQMDPIEKNIVEFTYTIPITAPDRKMKFEWEETSSECSNSCGKGTKIAKYHCIQTSTKNIVDPSFCAATSNPPAERDKCYGPCSDAVWLYGDWEPCSKTCGRGTQNRSLTCLSAPGGYTIESHYCAKHSKEETARSCNSDVCPEWGTENYTPCSVTCGEGKRLTIIHCKQNDTIVNSALCGSFPRPVAMLINCTMEPCKTKQIYHPKYSHYFDERRPQIHTNSIDHSSQAVIVSIRQVLKYEWRTSRWGDCSVSCNGGKKIRSVKCANLTNSDSQDYVEDNYCDLDKKPINVTICANFRCPTWNFGLWGECNDDCKRYRQVLCQDHRGKESRQCPMEMKPPEVESCCQFRWRTIWKPCNVSCGEGYRTGERVCMRLLPKSHDNPHPVKNGKKIDVKYCANLNMTNYKTLEKKCKKHCEFRWEVAPWSKCSVGCGSGWATRNVTCTNGRSMSNECDRKLKPINTRQCDTRSHCSWRIGKWKNCKCEGYRKRRVICHDNLRNHQATSCSEQLRPAHRQQCTPPPNCSCKGIQQQRNERRDGEYMLSVKGKQVSIYCHNMKTHKPQEYLTLKTGIVDNYSLYYNKRSHNAAVCSTRSGDWVDNSISSYGATHFHKIRLNLQTMQVTDDDFQFADTVGKPQMLGSAGDCYSNTGQCPQGDFSINLEGTPFRIRPKTQWETKGQNSVMQSLIKLEPPYQRVRARCGGYCGSCFVSRNTTLHLDIL